MILDIRGQETGNGEQLARFVLENRDKNTDNKKLLYLTGDKNRDTIPKILSSNKDQGPPILLHSLQVYETHGATDLEKNIRLLVAREAQLRQGTSICTCKYVADSRSKDNIWWVVFFAPSSSLLAYAPESLPLCAQRRFRYQIATPCCQSRCHRMHDVILSGG